MIMIAILIGMFFLILSYGKYKSLLKLNSVYTFMWSSALFFIGINYAGIESMSDYSIILIIVSIVVFNITYLSFGTNYDIDRIELRQYLLKLNLKTVYVVNFICYIFIIPITIKAIRIIITYGFSNLRSYAFDVTGGLVTELTSKVTAWIIYPVFLVTMIIAALYIALGLKEKIIIVGILDVAIYILTFGGRSLIIRFVLYVLFAYIAFNHSFFMLLKKMPLKQKVILLVIFAFFLYLVSLRKWEGLSIFENIVIYLFGSEKYFDILVQDINLKGNLYGTGLFGIILNPLMYFSNIFLRTDFILSEQAIQQVTDPFVSIGKSNFNALPSMLYIFWRDYGEVGIVIGTFLFTLIITYVERKIKRKVSLFNLILLIFISYAVFQSTTDFPIYKIQHFFTLLIMYILCEKMIKERR